MWESLCLLQVLACIIFFGTAHVRCAFYFILDVCYLRAVVLCMHACGACTYVFFNVCTYDAFMCIHNTRKTKDREEYCTRSWSEGDVLPRHGQIHGDSCSGAFKRKCAALLSYPLSLLQFFFSLGGPAPQCSMQKRGRQREGARILQPRLTLHNTRCRNA